MYIEIRKHLVSFITNCDHYPTVREVFDHLKDFHPADIWKAIYVDMDVKFMFDPSDSTFMLLTASPKGNYVKLSR